jgi:hypothetical protein
MAGRTYKCALRCSRAGVLYISTFHMQVIPESGFSDPDPNDVASGIWGHIQTEFINVTPDNMSIDDLIIDEAVNPPDIGANGSHTISVGGSLVATGNRLPDALCANINWQTGVSSRNARGWMHPPPPGGSNYINENQWTGPYLGLVDALGAKMVGEIDFGSFFPARGTFVTFSRTRFKELQSPWYWNIQSHKTNPSAKWLRTRTTAP